MASIHTPNPDQASIVYIEHYLDVVESLPNSLARILSRIHELDIQRTKIANNLEESLTQYTQNSISDVEKHRLLNKFRSMLVQLQNLSDNKIGLAQTMVDQIEIKSRQLDSQCRETSSTSSVSKTHSSSTNSVNVNSYTNTNGNPPAPPKATTSTTSTNAQLNPSSFARTDSNSNSNSNTERSIPNTTSQKDNGKEQTANHSNGNGKRATRRYHGNKKESNQDSNGGSGDERPSSPGTSERAGTGKRVTKRGMKRTHKNEVKRRKAYNYNRDSPTDSFADKVEPDEPTYCLCKQVSYGEMVCCDNTNCKIEWFHFMCVGLTANPKGRWYCPHCRGERSNILRKKPAQE